MEQKNLNLNNMFPTKEEAKEIGLEAIKRKLTIFKITDDPSEIPAQVYGLPEGCWYIHYRNSIHENFLLEGSCLIAISKIDGRVLYDRVLNDEG